MRKNNAKAFIFFFFDLLLWIYLITITLIINHVPLNTFSWPCFYNKSKYYHFNMTIVSFGVENWKIMPPAKLCGQQLWCNTYLQFGLASGMGWVKTSHIITHFKESYHLYYLLFFFFLYLQHKSKKSLEYFTFMLFNVSVFSLFF